MNNEYKAEIVPIVLNKHPNADLLSVVKVFDYEVVVNTKSWEGIPYGVYIEPETIVDVNRPEFSFLKTKVDQTKHLIRIKRLRGVYSYGLLVPVTDLIWLKPEEYIVGTNLFDRMNLEHYQPQTKEEKSFTVRGHKIKSPMIEFCDNHPQVEKFLSKYDVENFKKYGYKEFDPLEVLVATEKIHGQNVRFVYDSTYKKMFCGTRNQWKAEYPRFLKYDRTFFSNQGLTEDVIDEIMTKLEEKKNNIHKYKSNVWKILDKYPQIKVWCEAHPDFVLYGELFGEPIQGGFHYGVENRDIDFRAFDIFYKTSFMQYGAFLQQCNLSGIPIVPEVKIFTLSQMESLDELCTGNSLLTDKHIREGVVIKPCHEERQGKETHRAIFKLINPKYLEM